MILLHPRSRLPLYWLAGIAMLVGLGVLGLAAVNGYPMPLVWRGLVALGVGLVALRLVLRHVARQAAVADEGSSPGNP